MATALIGLTTSRFFNSTRISMIGTTEAYVQAILNAGGLPVLIPVGLPLEQLRTLSRSLHGLLLTGGGDIDPVRFNGENHPQVYDVDPVRDQLEITLLEQARQAEMPFFGICRGLQLVNVAFGGALYTDIADQHPDPIKHNYLSEYPRTHLAHPVQIEGGTRLAQILNIPTLKVNSLHHQGVSRVAAGLTISAYAPDGLVEGLEMQDHPFGLAVQWHPEWMQDHAPMRTIFQAFIAAAAAYTPGG